MKIEIDHEKMEKVKKLYVLIQKQICEDYTAETGSSLFKEDSMAAALVCLIIDAYKIVNNKPVRR